MHGLVNQTQFWVRFVIVNRKQVISNTADLLKLKSVLKFSFFSMIMNLGQ